MKKSVLIALTLIFASFAASAQVHNYPLKICGVQVFDTYGRLLKTLSPTTKQAVFNVRDLRNGIYTIIIKNENGTTARQFVVKH